MVGILFGGIALGAAIAFGIETATFVASMEGVPGGFEPFLGQYLVDQGLWAALAAAITAAGAWSRLR